jgi:hypothetical protein
LAGCDKNGEAGQHAAELWLRPEVRDAWLARREVEFTEFMITEDGIKPADKYTTSIKDFPNPRNISEVKA